MMEPVTKKQKTSSGTDHEEKIPTSSRSSEQNYISPDDNEKPGCRLQLYPLPEAAHQQKLASTTDSKSDATSKKKKKKDVMILPPSHQSSKMTGAQVLFFIDLDYTPQGKPIDLNSSTIVQILEAVFKFLYGNNENTSQNEESFRKDGKTVTEIYEHHCKLRPWLAWMSANDRINFKSISEDEWTSKANEYLNVFESKDDVGQEKRAVYEIISLIHHNYFDNKCTEHDFMKSMFRIADKLMPQVARLRFNGEACFKLRIVAPTEFVSDSCTRISPESCVTVMPDSVFATRNALRKTTSTGKIAVEVYGPREGSSSSASEAEMTLYAKELEEQGFATNTVPKPERTVDCILSREYTRKANTYLRQSVPRDCRDYDTTSKMTGQHVLQLISLAEEQRLNGRYCPSIPLDTYTPVGIFLKNEYIFFSKLEINEEKLQHSKPAAVISASRDNTVDNTVQLTKQKGVVTFSNWRLDLTCSNHRIALLIFLLELLDVEKMPF